MRLPPGSAPTSTPTPVQPPSTDKDGSVNLSAEQSHHNPDPFVYIDPTEWHPTEYTTTHRPRPLSELGGTGRRKVPHIEMGGDFPFLRIKKPQPEYLSRVLTQKIRNRGRRTDALHAMEDSLEDAVAEDEWEKVVDAVLSGDEPWCRSIGEEAPADGTGEYDKNTPNTQDLDVRLKSGRKIRVAPSSETYGGSIWRYGFVHIQALLNNEKVDQVYRARAMRDIVIQEQKLVAEEKAARRSKRRRRWEEKLRSEGREDEIQIADARVRERRAAAEAGLPKPHARAT